MRYVVLSLFLLVSTYLFAQTTRDVAFPEGDRALVYYFLEVEFDKEVRDSLEGKELELIFDIDYFGTARLSAFNGTSLQLVRDSFELATKALPPFEPAMRDSVALASAYFLKFAYPEYVPVKSYHENLPAGQFRSARMEDFEYLEKDGSRLDVAIGGSFIAPLPNDYQGLGGGMYTEVSYTDRKARNFALWMTFSEARGKQPFPIVTTRKQFDNRLNLGVGIGYGRWFDRIGVRADLGLAQMNLSEKLDAQDDDWLREGGWTLGLSSRYPVNIGKESTYVTYDSPSVLAHQLDLGLGVRYWHYGLKEARRLIFELTVGYRLTQFGIEKYRLKKSFLER